MVNSKLAKAIIIGFFVGIFLYGLTNIVRGQSSYQTATLGWDPPIVAVTSFHIYRGNVDCSAQGPLQPLLNADGTVASVSGNVYTFVDNRVPDVTSTFCWEVTAVDNAKPVGYQESVHSGRASKSFVSTQPTAPTPPPAPTNLRVLSVQ